MEKTTLKIDYEIKREIAHRNIRRKRRKRAFKKFVVWVVAIIVIFSPALVYKFLNLISTLTGFWKSFILTDRFFNIMIILQSCFIVLCLLIVARAMDIMVKKEEGDY